MIATLLCMVALSAPCLSTFQIQTADSLERQCLDVLHRLAPRHSDSCCSKGCGEQKFYIRNQHSRFNDYYRIGIDALTSDGVNIASTDGGFLTSFGFDHRNGDNTCWKFIFDREDIPDHARLANLEYPDRNIFYHLGYGFLSVPIRDDKDEIDPTEYDNFYFKFIEDYDEIIDVEFDLDAAKLSTITSVTPITSICDNINGGSRDATQEIGEDITVTNAVTFERETGVEVTSGIRFNTGIPFLSGGRLSAGLTSTETFTFGESNTVSRTFTFKKIFHCAPGELTQAECSIFSGNIRVPYTMKVRGAGTGIEYESSGYFEGVSSYNGDCKVVELDPDTREPINDPDAEETLDLSNIDNRIIEIGIVF